MNWQKTYEKVWSSKLFILGITFFPYQLSLGVSLRYFEGFGFRFYIGPIKIWGGQLKRKEKK